MSTSFSGKKLGKNYFIFLFAILLLAVSCRSNRQWADVFLKKGEVYMRQKKYTLALTEYQKALRVNPSDYRGFLGAADAYLMIGNCEVAIEEINGASVLNPNIPADYFYKKAQCLAKRNPPDYQSALEEASLIAIQRDPSNPVYPQFAGDLYRALGNTELAEKFYQKAQELRGHP